MGRKVVLLWNSVEAFDTESQESYAEWSPLLGIGAIIGNFGLLVPLAAFGVCVTWADRRRLCVLVPRGRWAVGDGAVGGGGGGVERRRFPPPERVSVVTRSLPTARA